MCLSIETVITAVYHPQSGQTDLWLTESDDGGQFELLGCVTGARDDLVNLFERLRNALQCEGPLGVLDRPR